MFGPEAPFHAYEKRVAALQPTQEDLERAKEGLPRLGAQPRDSQAGLDRMVDDIKARCVSRLGIATGGEAATRAISAIRAAAPVPPAPPSSPDSTPSLPLSSHLTRRDARTAKFSRRRAESESADVDYINDRNKHFNKKIERAFGEHTKDIKANLERGTALPDQQCVAAWGAVGTGRCRGGGAGAAFDRLGDRAAVRDGGAEHGVAVAARAPVWSLGWDACEVEGGLDA